ncbi:hypothetical protein EON67_12595 [archaeon]|nr:MAG: hypothetical protein EON67_12595 [archaeon]
MQLWRARDSRAVRSVRVLRHTRFSSSHGFIYSLLLHDAPARGRGKLPRASTSRDLRVVAGAGDGVIRVWPALARCAHTEEEAGTDSASEADDILHTLNCRRPRLPPSCPACTRSPPRLPPTWARSQQRRSHWPTRPPPSGLVVVAACMPSLRMHAIFTQVCVHNVWLLVVAGKCACHPNAASCGVRACACRLPRWHGARVRC